MDIANRPAISPFTVVAEFTVRRRAYLSPSGEVTGPLPEFATSANELVRLYRGMVLIRALDVKAVALQRTGRLGTYPAALGQEAVMVGVASAMRSDDVFFPTYRENGALVWRGVTIEEIFTYWGGDERGSLFLGSPCDFPICVPVGSHAPHAAGAAYAFRLAGKDNVAVCVFGDGATSKGDVWEAMNFAGVHRLPIVFVANNNQWAISVPLKMQTAAATLAQKAIAAGIEGEQVDGNDVIAVRATMEEALHAARTAKGPRLIEAVTYRLGDHTTADDARRYRSDDEVKAQWQKEPIARLRKYLVAAGHWNKSLEEELISECQRRVGEAAEHYLAMDPRAPETMFDHLYAQLPKALVRQRSETQEIEDG